IGVCSTSMVFSNRSSSVFIWLMSFMRKGHWPPENGSRKLLLTAGLGIWLGRLKQRGEHGLTPHHFA
ncbi:hypothetical protein, partial [Aeromonas jandaei]|uniref:hypothetical protein n=1 Tax=Aeromonas jandaei TaxID=650 RepID=UPI002B05276F